LGGNPAGSGKHAETRTFKAKKPRHGTAVPVKFRVISEWSIRILDACPFSVPMYIGATKDKMLEIE